MKPALSLLLLLSCGSLAMAVPATIELEDGRTLEGVTSATVEDGKLKVTHSGGVSRHEVATLKPESRNALRIGGGDAQGSRIPDLKRIETTDGKVYEDVRSVKVKPSFLSFVHRDGAASVKFKELPEAIRQAFGYDEAAAIAFDEERAAAEAAMAKAEAEMAKAEANAEQRKARQAQRAEAIRLLEFSNYGSYDYWSKSARERQLMDAVTARLLQQKGLSPDETNFYLDQARFR